MSKNLVVIVWYNHSRRAETLALELGGRLTLIYERSLRRGEFIVLRYIVQAWKTWQFLERERPTHIVVQAPPIFAPLIVAVWSKFRGRSQSSASSVSFAIDCHTGIFYEHKWTWALPLLRQLSKQAAVTVVASEAALQTLQRWQVKAVFLVDGLPSMSTPTGSFGLQGEKRVAVVSSFDDDEPVAEVFAAARLLPQVTFYCSGDPRRVPSYLAGQKPDNVVLTGFLPDEVYAGLLNNVHGLVVLTKEPNILNCGAYEALASAKPAVLSDWAQIRRYFTRGFIYVRNTPEAIAAGVQEMLENRATLEPEIVAMRSELVAKREPDFEKFVALLTHPVHVPPDSFGAQG